MSLIDVARDIFSSIIDDRLSSMEMIHGAYPSDELQKVIPALRFYNYEENGNRTGNINERNDIPNGKAVY